MGGEKVNSQDLKSAAQFLKLAVDAMADDGAISPDEWIFLAQAAIGILKKLLPLTDKRFVLFGIRAGISVLEWLVDDLQKTSDANV